MLLFGSGFIVFNFGRSSLHVIAAASNGIFFWCICYGVPSDFLLHLDDISFVDSIWPLSD